MGEQVVSDTFLEVEVRPGVPTPLVAIDQCNP